MGERQQDFERVLPLDSIATFTIRRRARKMMAITTQWGGCKSGGNGARALRIFEEHTGSALDQALSEAAKLIEHRVFRWKAAG